jgi:hypothetical protein
MSLLVSIVKGRAKRELAYPIIIWDFKVVRVMSLDNLAPTVARCSGERCDKTLQEPASWHVNVNAACHQRVWSNQSNLQSHRVKPSQTTYTSGLTQRRRPNAMELSAPQRDQANMTDSAGLESQSQSRLLKVDKGSMIFRTCGC